MSVTRMLPFSVTEPARMYTESQSHFQSNTTSNTRFSASDNNSLLGSFASKPMPTLRVKTELFVSVDGPSPPPPALSPANSSPPHLPGCAFNQTSSPSPPLIVAEIGSNASTGSRDSSDKNLRHGLAFNSIKPSLTPCDFVLAQSLPTRATAVPRINSLSSSSPSSSSSTTSSSSTCNDYGVQATNGLPILEKISRVLGSPKLPYTESISAVRTKENSSHQAVVQSPIGQSNAEFSETLPSSPVATVQESAAETKRSPISAVDSDKPCATKTRTPASTSKRKRKATASRKSIKSKKNKYESDSDFELDNSRIGRVSRGRADAVALLSRTKQAAAASRQSRRSNEATDSSQPIGGAEAAANRRYLESPFLCLCQSRGAVVGLSSHRCASRAFETRTNETCTAVSSTESITLSAAMPAHVVSPALRGFTAAVGATYMSIPATCPLSHSKDRPPAADTQQDQGEVRTIFSSLTYRPSAQLRSRDLPTLAEITPTRPWLCVFCGQDNTFLDLGSLYGPYWLTDLDRLQLPSGAVDSLPASDAHSSDCTSVSSSLNPQPTPERFTRRARSGAITKSTTVTRAGASHSRATVANAGELRLVIKARNGQCTPQTRSDKQSSSAQPILPPPRVSAAGEVWFHLDCVLWAPGTCVDGSGSVSGLDGAVQLALDTTCSNCDKVGAVLSCCSRGCNLSYHYHCALISECQLNHDQLSLFCKKHKISTA